MISIKDMLSGTLSGTTSGEGKGGGAKGGGASGRRAEDANKLVVPVTSPRMTLGVASSNIAFFTSSGVELVGIASR